MQSISRPTSRPARVLAQGRQPVGVQGLVLAAARDGDQVTKPRAHQLQALVERRRVGAAPCAARLQLELAGDGALPRLGSFSSRSSSASLHLRLRGRARRSSARSSSGLQGAASTHCGVVVLRQHAAARRPRPRLRGRRALTGQPRGALGIAARQPRARERRLGRDALARSSCSATRAGGIAPKRIGRQRDGIVSSSRPGAELVSTKCAKRGGLLERLQQRVLGLVVHAVRVDDHEHAHARLERAAAPPGARPASRTSSTRISCAPRGSTQAMSGCTPDSTRRRVSVGVLGVARDQRRRELPRRRALAAAGGPVEEVGVRQRGRVAQGRLERDARAGLMLGGGLRRVMRRTRASTSRCTSSAVRVASIRT